MDAPGKELLKEYREVAAELVSNQGWGYNDGSGRGGHPMLFPADKEKSPLTVPTTPGKNPRGFKNWLSGVRQRGGIWPVGRSK